MNWKLLADLLLIIDRLHILIFIYIVELLIFFITHNRRQVAWTTWDILNYRILYLWIGTPHLIWFLRYLMTVFTILSYVLNFAFFLIFYLIRYLNFCTRQFLDIFNFRKYFFQWLIFLMFIFWLFYFLWNAGHFSFNQLDLFVNWR